MGFDNFYPNRKDHGKPYRKSKAFDYTCRNHGSCGYCKANRLYFDLKNRSVANIDLKIYKIYDKHNK